MKIDRHISDLLYDHECVIVPEMGGFITSYSPASIRETNGKATVLPPSKKISFNVFLTHNDGLLANHVAVYETLNYNDALKKILDYVEHYRHETGAGRKFAIEEVGMLYVDAEHHVQFEPFKSLNYLKDSFGFAEVGVAKEPVKKSANVHLRASLRQREEKEKKRSNMVNTLLLIGSLFWFCMNVYFIVPKKMNFAPILSGLNPFHYETTPPSPAPPVSSEKKEIEKVTAPTVRVETVYIKEPAPAVKDSLSVSTPIAPSQSLQQGNHYYLIAGAFRSPDNVTKLIADLKQQGFTNAEILEKASTGKALTMVSYGAFSSLDSALAQMSRLKQLNKESWIFRR